MAIDTFVENVCGTVLKALPSSIFKCRPHDDPPPPTPAGIQDEISLKDQMRKRWQVTRHASLRAEIVRLQRSVTSRLNEWR